MPLIAVLVTGILLGMVFAWCATDELKQRRSTLQSEAAWVVLAFGVLVFGPSAGSLVSFHGDWSLSFWWAADAMPAALLALAVLACALAPLAGFAFGAAMLRRRQPVVLIYVGAGALLGCATASLLALPRLLVEASYLEFHNGFGTRPIAGSALGYSVLWVTALVAGVTLWTALALRRIQQRPIHELAETHVPGRSIRPAAKVGDR